MPVPLLLSPAIASTGKEAARALIADRAVPQSPAAAISRDSQQDVARRGVVDRRRMCFFPALPTRRPHFSSPFEDNGEAVHLLTFGENRSFV
jgi:hypothetical protein